MAERCPVMSRSRDDDRERGDDGRGCEYDRASAGRESEKRHDRDDGEHGDDGNRAPEASSAVCKTATRPQPQSTNPIWRPKQE